MAALADLEPRLAAAPGRVSVWYGPPGGEPEYTRSAGELHYAASTMKLAVLLGAHRLADAGAIDLRAPVSVHDDFSSAAEQAPRFTVDPEEDCDEATWARLGEQVPLDWLLRRMIVRSGNLATNLVVERVGMSAVNEAWRSCGAPDSVVSRLLNDELADAAGVRNLVTAADLAAVLGAVATGRAASPVACHAMLALLAANEHNPEIPAGLPAGTPVAHKNGWVAGIRHDAALVGTGADRYVLVVCTSTELDGDQACALVADVAAASWRDSRVS